MTHAQNETIIQVQYETITIITFRHYLEIVSKVLLFPRRGQ